MFDTVDLSPRLAVNLDTAMSIAFGPDGKTLAVATVTRLVKLWSLTTNRELAELKHAGRAILHQIGVSADGRTLASRGVDSVSVWNLAGADERMELAGHDSGVTSASFSPDGATLASTSKDGAVKLWASDTGLLRRTLGGYGTDVQTCAFSPDGALLATGSPAGVRFWDARTWHEVYAPRDDDGRTGNITGVVFLQGVGAALGVAATSRGSGLGIWRVHRPGDVRLTLEPIMRRSADSCLHLAVSPDNALAAFIESDIIVRVWDVARAQALAFSGPRALLGWHSLAFRSARELVFISSDRVAVVWDVRANWLVRTIGRPGTFEGFHIALSPDGRWLAAEATPSSVAIVDLELGEIVFAFREERSPIWSLAWSPDARRLAVGLSDGGLVVWDLERVRTLLAESGIDAPSTSAHREKPHAAGAVSVLDLDRVAAVHEPERVLARADAAATSSRWEEAAAAFAKLVNEGALADPYLWFGHAILRLAVGDVAGYQSVRRKLLETFQKEDGREWLEFMSHACVLAPAGPGEKARALQLAKRRLSVSPNDPWSEHVLGLALHRSDQFAEADALLRGSLNRDPGWDFRVLDWLVLAMADHRLGRHDEARRWLEQAETWLAPRLRGRVGGADRAIPETWHWVPGVQMHLLLREAHALINAGLPELPEEVFAAPKPIHDR